MVDAYYVALKGFSDDDLKEIAYRAVDTMRYFPKIAELKSLLAHKTHDKELKDRFTCPACGNYVSCIVDGLCWTCKQGVPLSVGRKPLKISEEKPREEDNFKILEAYQCQECGTVGRCIKEPSDTGPILCRECYTGLTSQEMREMYRKIISGMSLSL